MLDLVLAHRNEVGEVEQDVRRLQHGIVEEPRHHLLLPRRLFLERHLPLELAERRDRVEDPGEFGMFGHLRLHEQRRLRRVDPGGEEAHRHLVRAPLQVRRLVGRDDGVVVDHAEERLELVLQLHPVLHRPEIVSYVQFARRLDAAEDPCHQPKSMECRVPEQPRLTPDAPPRRPRVCSRWRSRRRRRPRASSATPTPRVREIVWREKGRHRLRQRSGPGRRNAHPRRGARPHPARRDPRRGDGVHHLARTAAFGRRVRRRSARRHDELPARLPGVRGLDRRARRRRARRGRGARRPDGRDVHGDRRRWRAPERRADPRLGDRQSAARRSSAPASRSRATRRSHRTSPSSRA